MTAATQSTGTQYATIEEMDRLVPTLTQPYTRNARSSRSYDNSRGYSYYTNGSLRYASPYYNRGSCAVVRRRYSGTSFNNYCSTASCHVSSSSYYYATRCAPRAVAPRSMTGRSMFSTPTRSVIPTFPVSASR